MKPENVLSLPLSVGPYGCDVMDSINDWVGEGQTSENAKDTDNAAALVTMCNAYPLALKLAEACEVYMGEPTDARKAVNMAIALTAFKAHRTPAQHDEKGGDQ